MPEFHSMLLSTDDPQALVGALAASAGLTIPAASLPIVTSHVVVAASMAKLLFDFTPASDELATAPVFTLPTLA